MLCGFYFKPNAICVVICECSLRNYCNAILKITFFVDYLFTLYLCSNQLVVYV